jgi:hypothetical protein
LKTVLQSPGRPVVKVLTGKQGRVIIKIALNLQTKLSIDKNLGDLTEALLPELFVSLVPLIYPLSLPGYLRFQFPIK